jgi:ketosteroid isomerase-like protein
METDGPAADIELQQRTLARIDEEWNASVRAEDVERALTFWSDDAVVLAPGAPPFVGLDPVRWTG